ncbi:MAG: hypothetical protein ACUVTX_06695 [Bacteroidales bacterium]
MGATFMGLSSIGNSIYANEVQDKKSRKKVTGFDHLSLTPTPPLGWNSYDCYGGSGSKFDSANEWRLMENLEAFSEKLKPFGYEYFVLDCRWFAPTADGSLTRLD